MMTRGIWTKWIIGAACLLLILAAGCILYYQHTTAGDKQSTEQADKLLQEWEADKAKKSTTADKEVTNTPAESTTPIAEKPTTKITDNKEKDMHSVDLTEQTQETEKAKEVRVSPHGFGPYPKLPVGWNDAWHTLTVKEELAMRVWIKLLEQGVNVVGMGYGGPNKLLIPTIQGTVYVRTDAQGYIKSYKGHPNDTAEIRAIRQAKLDALIDLDQDEEITDPKPLSLKLDDIPKHIKVIDISEGIDPYAFLNLTKE